MKAKGGDAMTPQEEFYDKLRIDYNEYLDNLRTMPPQQIIEKSYETVTKEGILTCFEGREYLTETESMALIEKNYGLDDFYSEWLDADTHYEDAIRDCINASIDMLQQEYLLQDPTLRRFMGVDLIDFLSNVAAKVVVHYPGDITIDKEQLLKIAATPNAWDKRLAYHCCSWGTHIVNESEMFIRDTFAYNCWTGYHEKDPDILGYIIEITDFRDGIVIGNAYSVGDYYEHVMHVRETALVLDSVTLTYSSEWGAHAGKTITVPRYEYDNDRHHLMSESGDVMSIQHHPSDV